MSKAGNEAEDTPADLVKTAAIEATAAAVTTFVAEAGIVTAVKAYNDHTDKTSVLKTMADCSKNHAPSIAGRCRDSAVRKFCYTSECKTSVWNAWFALPEHKGGPASKND